MKRILALALALMLVLPVIALSEEAAWPEDKLKLLEENLIVFSSYGNTTAYYTAIVENLSSEMIYFTNAYVYCYDAEGKQLGEGGYILLHPGVIMPGEKGYLYSMTDTLGEGEISVASHKLVVDAQETSYGEDNVIPLPSEASYKVVERAGTGETEGQFVVTISNDKEEPVFHLNSLLILRDEAGKLVYMDSVTQSLAGIPAGGKALLRDTLDQEILAALQKDEREPKAVECFSWYQTY